MRHLSTTRSIAIFARPLALCILFSAPLTLVAQEDGKTGPPKVLVIQRELLKPGKTGSLHQKTESAFIQAFSAAKSNSYYFGLDSMTGPSRALFFSGYSSFDAWQKDSESVRKNATLLAAVDRAAVADGDLLLEFAQSAFVRRDDLSYNVGNLIGKRYMEVALFVTHPGHEHDIEDLAKMYVAGYKAAAADTNWVTYQMVYGSYPGTVYLVLTTLKSLADADHELVLGEAFEKQMGPDGMKKMGELSAASIASQMSNLFEINPKISYPPAEWIKAEPDFWKPKPAATPVKKAEAAPVK